MVPIIEQGRSLSCDAAPRANISGVIREASAERRWLAVEIAEASSVVVEKVASAEIHFLRFAEYFQLRLLLS